MCIHIASCQADSVTEGGVDFIWQLHQSQKLLVFQKLLLREPTPAAASYRRLPERHTHARSAFFWQLQHRGKVCVMLTLLLLRMLRRVNPAAFPESTLPWRSSSQLSSGYRLPTAATTGRLHGCIRR